MKFSAIVARVLVLATSSLVGAAMSVDKAWDKVQMCQDLGELELPVPGLLFDRATGSARVWVKGDKLFRLFAYVDASAPPAFRAGPYALGAEEDTGTVPESISLGLLHCAKRGLVLSFSTENYPREINITVRDQTTDLTFVHRCDLKGNVLSVEPYKKLVRFERGTAPLLVPVTDASSDDRKFELATADFTYSFYGNSNLYNISSTGTSLSGHASKLKLRRVKECTNWNGVTVGPDNPFAIIDGSAKGSSSARGDIGSLLLPAIIIWWIIASSAQQLSG